MKTSNYLLKINKEYAIYINKTRHIAKVQDGLKDGQRIALWLLSKESKKIKTAGLTGAMMESLLYMHGDASASGAISLLAAPWRNNIPLIEGLGAFGSRTKPIDGIGAPRYTEVKKAKASETFLYTDLDIVPMEPNYDGSRESPAFFLPLIPTILLNGVSGVSMGFSTEILPRSLDDLIGATEDALKGKPIRDMLPTWMKYNVTVNRLEPNKYEIQGKVEIIDTSTVRVIELPPDMKIEKFRERLNLMEDNDQIQGYTDRSSDRIDITIKMKRGTIKDWTEQQVIDFFKIKEKTTERLVVIDWTGESVLTYENPQDLVNDFAKWRLSWYSKRYSRLKDIDDREKAYWCVIQELVKDGFPTRLPKMNDKAEVEADVIRVATKHKITLDEQQIERIVTLPTYRWTKQAANDIKVKIDELTTRINNYTDLLNSPDKLKQVYLDELSGIKKAKLNVG